MMRKMTSAEPERRVKARKSTSRVDEDDSCDGQDDLGGNQQRRREQNTERHLTPDNTEHLDSVAGGCQYDECLDVGMGSADSVANRSNDQQKVDEFEDMTKEAIDHRDIDNLRSPYTLWHESQPSHSRQQPNVPMSKQASQPCSAQRPVSPQASNEVQLTDLEAQNKERLLTARKNQSHWDKQNIWAFDSDAKKKGYHSVEEKKNIKVRYQRTY
jgi:hypothetical protein